MNVLGIMSGTSLDGVDYAVCSFTKSGVINLEDYWHVPFSRELKTRLHRAARNESTSWEVAQLHHDLGRAYAAGIGRAQDEGEHPPRIELVGLHGQTIFHNPAQPQPSTFQLGEPAYLAEILDAPVISNFRAADLAAGGQGAPLATLFHLHVFGRKGRHVAINNLGGISNVTSVDWTRGKEPQILAFDTGPANVLIDMAARESSKGKRQFDKNGALARKGKMNGKLLFEWLKHPFFHKSPPKSTGRELFGESFFRRTAAQNLSASDLSATLTELTARSIALNYRLHLPRLPDEVFLCGGGAENTFLVSRITALLQELKSDLVVRSTADLGWKTQVIEAAAFALLAWRTWNGMPGNIPATTGAKSTRLLGQTTVSRPAARGVRRTSVIVNSKDSR